MQFLFFILGYFLPVYSPNDPKNQNFQNTKKKTPGDIIICVYMCTKNNDHMMYCYWDMVHDRWTNRKSDIERGVPHPKMWRQSQHKEKIWDKSYEYLENSKANHIKSFVHGQHVNITMQDPVIGYFQIRVTSFL